MAPPITIGELHLHVDARASIPSKATVETRWTIPPPFQIVERRRPHQFQVRKGNALLSTHANFRDAEDAALRYWLGPKPMGHDDE